MSNVAVSSTYIECLNFKRAWDGSFENIHLEF